MLQQTRVDTVIPYYERFLDWFPTVADLAQAPEAKALKSMGRLGLYSRVWATCKKAAKQISWRTMGGAVPSKLARKYLN